MTDQAEGDPKIGLALSGGGIRSATFSLGVLQALAQRGKLASFDLLSTVSGGGYAGSWLSAWIHRTGPAFVQEQLARSGSRGYAENSPQANEPREVSWLRKYSNYLAPRLGLFSADSLTLITTWTRNVFLNLLVLLSFVAVVLLLPRLFLKPMQWAAKSISGELGIAAFVIAALVACVIMFDLNVQGFGNRRRNWWPTTSLGVLWTVIVPTMIASLLATIWIFRLGAFDVVGSIAYSAGFLAILGFLQFVIQAAKTRTLPFGQAMVHAGAGLTACAVAVLLLHAAWEYMLTLRLENIGYAALLTFGPAGFLVIFGICGSIFVGLVGRRYYERSREWWSRMNALLITVGGAWFAVCALALYAPAFVEWFVDSLPGWGRGLLGAGWLGSLLVTLLVPKPAGLSKTTGEYFDRALNLLATFFVAGLLLVLSSVVHWALMKGAELDETSVNKPQATSSLELRLKGAPNSIESRIEISEPAAPRFGDYRTARLADLERLTNLELRSLGPLDYVPSAFLLVLVALVYLSFRVDVNKFSLHNMYKNRLTRCYLGASNRSRKQQAFTGLDEGDDLSLAALAGLTARGVAQRPRHLINAALNISQGKNLAWQERKAAAFTLAPDQCGYRLAKTQGDGTDPEKELYPKPSMKPTTEYASDDAEEKGFTLGMAMATSGAAVSPNMGRASRPALAFLLTVFNVRLGRWSPNPAHERASQPTPHFGLLCLLQELFGLANESRKFVYLSDGGHFDNLGLYELVARRCEVIWVVDAGADPQRQFGDIAESVRKCRVDFGVEIELDLTALRAEGPDMRSAAGFVRGKVLYEPENPQGLAGDIVLIKPSLGLARLEPADILGYAARNESFPHQSTTDQFFDESQFESYRRLGLWIAAACLTAHVGTLPNVTLPAETVPRPPRRLIGRNYAQRLTRFPWVTIARRYRLEPGENTLGTGAGNDIIVPQGLGDEVMGRVVIGAGQQPDEWFEIGKAMARIASHRGKLVLLVVNARWREGLPEPAPPAEA